MNGASTVWCTSSPAAGAKPRPQHLAKFAICGGERQWAAAGRLRLWHL